MATSIHAPVLVKPKTCATCQYWQGNENLLGGYCDVFETIKSSQMTCENHQSFIQKSLSNLVTIIIYLLFCLMLFGSVYFFGFLFHRAGYF